MDVIAGKTERKNDPKFKAMELFKMWETNHNQNSYSCKQFTFDDRNDSNLSTGTEASGIVPLGKTKVPSKSKRARITETELAMVAPAGFWKSLILFMHRALLQYSKSKITFFGDILLQAST